MLWCAKLIHTNCQRPMGETIKPTPQHQPQNAPHTDAEEKRLRADGYLILAATLNAPPSRDTLDALAALPATDAQHPLADAWRQLRDAARDADCDLLNDEYHDLFIGLGRGEIVPFASWHLTGFLMEKPLSALRDDLRAFGMQRAADNQDPEDHIAALCEAMAIAIDAPDIPEAREREFFLRHIHSWAGKFFTALTRADAAQFYRAVGEFGARFIRFENEYLQIQTH